jgi:hypothetical protein
MFHFALTFPAILNAQLLIVTLTRFNILEGPYPKRGSRHAEDDVKSIEMVGGQMERLHAASLD